MKKLKAFTLMEVLISLTLVGTIAVLTVPNAISNYNKKVNATRVQRFYNQMSDAIAKYKGENKTDKVNAIWANEDSLKTFLTKYFDVAKDCEFGKLTDAAENGCLASSYKYLDGTELSLTKTQSVTGRTNYNIEGKTSSELAAMGITINNYREKICSCSAHPEFLDCKELDDNGGSSWNGDEVRIWCSLEYKLDISENNYCVALNTGATVCLTEGAGAVVIDVNGKSSPNMKGRDLFAFTYSSNGEISDDATKCTEEGFSGCFGKLMENQWDMNY